MMVENRKTKINPACAGASHILAVVIPAFNEAKTIEAVVTGVSQKALAIVVDDGSTDETVRRAQDAGAYVVQHPTNRGYDAALETGIRTGIELGCMYAVTMDADGQHESRLLDQFSEQLEKGADVVIGVRDCTQRWSEKLFSIVGQLIWGIRDPLCGMKGYKLSCFSMLNSLNTYESIGTELVIKLHKKGVSISQIPVKTQKRIGSSRFGGGLRANLRICKALWLGLIVWAIGDRVRIVRERNNINN